MPARPALPASLRRPIGVTAVLAALVAVALAARHSIDGGRSGFDRWLQPTMDFVRPPWLSPALAIDFAGEPVGAAMLVSALVAGCLLLGRRRTAVLAVLGPALTVAATTLAKPLVGRLIHDVYLSFPSGHTGLATALAFVLALLVVDLLHPRAPWGLPLVLLLVGAAGAAMAWSQIVLVTHYPTDTVGGFCTAIAIVPAAAWLIDRTADRAAAAVRTRPRRHAVWTGLLGLVAAVAMTTMITIVPTAAPGRPDLDGRHHAACRTDADGYCWVRHSLGVVPPPAAGPAAVCGAAALNGPATAPAGAVVVPAGDNSQIDFQRAGTTYWFAPGVHTLGDDQYSQIIPGDGATFVGAPGAVLDGQRINLFAFTQPAANVTVRHLTIRNFMASHNEGVVNHDSGNGWVIEHNTIAGNKGAGMMIGTNQKVIGNCLKDNGQYGINGYQAGNDVTGLVVEGNEVVGNNTDDWETQMPGCGCTGGMKFWSTTRTDVRNNWVHDNRGAGVWADFNNNDMLIENNLIDGNDGMGIFYEISYNAIIRGNTLRNNAWVTGRRFANSGDNFPIGAIYVSEAGGDRRLPARTASVEITGNVLENNWDGIVGWEDANRFCNSPASVNTGCNLVVGPENAARCSQPAIASEPLYSDCRWRTRQLDVHHNTFTFDPAKVDGGCPAGFCGRMALFSNNGSTPHWSPYLGNAVQEAITFKQDNRWHDNSYTGPWRFMPYDTGRTLTLAQWQDAPYNQDAGSS